MRLALLTLVLFGVAGCAPSEISLRDPQTGQTARCQGDGASQWNPQATEDCAQAYEAVGWVRLPQQ